MLKFDLFGLLLLKFFSLRDSNRSFSLLKTFPKRRVAQIMDTRKSFFQSLPGVILEGETTPFQPGVENFTHFMLSFPQARAFLKEWKNSTWKTSALKQSFSKMQDLKGGSHDESSYLLLRSCKIDESSSEITKPQFNLTVSQKDADVTRYVALKGLDIIRNYLRHLRISSSASKENRLAIFDVVRKQSNIEGFGSLVMDFTRFGVTMTVRVESNEQLASVRSLAKNYGFTHCCGPLDRCIEFDKKPWSVGFSFYDFLQKYFCKRNRSVCEVVHLSEIPADTEEPASEPSILSQEERFELESVGFIKIVPREVIDNIK